MNNILRKLNFLGYYQLIGGFLGVLIAAYTLLTLPVIKPLLFFIYSLGIALQGFSVYCGYLIYKQQYKRAINFSIINQLFQMLNVNVLGFSFFYSSGVFFIFGLDLTNDVITRFDFGISTFSFGIRKNQEIIAIGFNLIAFVAMNMLFSVKTKLEKFNDERV